MQSASTNWSPTAPRQRSALPVAWLGVALLATALLLPVGDAPWFSFWREWVAALGTVLVVAAALSQCRHAGWSVRARLVSWPSVSALLAGVALLQWATGHVPYFGGALLVAAYLAGFALAGVVAESLVPAQRDGLLDRLSWALLAAGTLSAALAVGQWRGWITLEMGLPLVAGRPVAHMEQANLLATLCMLALLATWRLVLCGRLWRAAGGTLAAALLFVIVLTQSRVAWLAAAAVLALVLWRARTPAWRGHRHTVLAAVAAAAAVLLGAIALPWVNGLTGHAGAALSERTSAGLRPQAWMLFADAVMHKPLLGWGAGQNGAAQFAVADAHPGLGWSFSSAHNLPLDLMVWFGIPLGLLGSAALAAAVVRRLRSAGTPAELATASLPLVLALHALVEFPLHYAYFLLPLGLWLGATSPAATTTVGARRPSSIAVPARPVILVVALLPGLGMAWLAREYIRVTEVRPIVGIDRLTGHPLLEAHGAPPDVLLLDHLKAFHQLAAAPLTADGSALAEERTAMTTFPFGPAITRYALLAGIRGHTEESATALRRICAFSSAAVCEHAALAWPQWREQWPQLPAWPAPARVSSGSIPEPTPASRPH